MDTGGINFYSMSFSGWPKIFSVEESKTATVKKIITGNNIHIWRGCLFVCLVGWLFYGVSTLFGSFNAELNHLDKKIQTIQFCISTAKCQNSSISSNSL